MTEQCVPVISALGNWKSLKFAVQSIYLNLLAPGSWKRPFQNVRWKGAIRHYFTEHLMTIPFPPVPLHGPHPPLPTPSFVVNSPTMPFPTFLQSVSSFYLCPQVLYHLPYPANVPLTSPHRIASLYTTPSSRSHSGITSSVKADRGIYGTPDLAWGKSLERWSGIWQRKRNLGFVVKDGDVGSAIVNQP